jgi:hypothetical protein
VTTQLGPEPSYCARNLLSKPLSPSQWATCWKYGWDEPTTGWMSRIGYDFGHDVLPALMVLVVVMLMLILVARSASRMW